MNCLAIDAVERSRSFIASKTSRGVISEYKYRELLADNTFAEAREESSFIWDNFYDESSGINEYDLTLFIREGQLYRKYEETHFQKAYSLDEVKRAALEAGM